MLWAIRHIPTGKYLPEYRGRGYTKCEPHHIEVSPPRFFTSERAAKNALTWWLKGLIYVLIESEYDEYGGRAYNYFSGPDTPIPQPHRKAEDMRIVRVELRFLD